MAYFPNCNNKKMCPRLGIHLTDHSCSLLRIFGLYNLYCIRNIWKCFVPVSLITVLPVFNICLLKSQDGVGTFSISAVDDDYSYYLGNVICHYLIPVYAQIFLVTPPNNTFFWERVFLYSSGWTGTHYIGQARLKLTESCCLYPPKCWN